MITNGCSVRRIFNAHARLVAFAGDGGFGFFDLLRQILCRFCGHAGQRQCAGFFQSVATADRDLPLAVCIACQKCPPAALTLCPSGHGPLVLDNDRANFQAGFRGIPGGHHDLANAGFIGGFVGACYCQCGERQDE